MTMRLEISKTNFGRSSNSAAAQLVFDATGYAGGISGFPRFDWVASFPFVFPPVQDYVAAVADAAVASGYLGLDLEANSLNYDNSSPSQVGIWAGYTAQYIDWVKQRQPSVQVGLWANFPVQVPGDEQIGLLDVAHWQVLDDFIAPYFVNRCDFGAVLLYHGFDGIEGFTDFAQKSGAETRRLFPSKLTYAVMWPYLNIDPPGNVPLDTVIWTQMLSVALTYFDRIIIWGGYGVGQGEPAGGVLNQNSWWIGPVRALKRAA